MKIAIVKNSDNPAASDAAMTMWAYLNSQGFETVLVSSDELYGQSLNLDILNSLEERVAGSELAIVLGGDGTILRTARIVRDEKCPILGINFGHLGFLANSSDMGVLELTQMALAGELHSELRSNLSCIVVCEGEDDPIECVSGPKHEFFALNDFAISRGSMGRNLEFKLDISDTHIGSYAGDGIIIASATGSTAYALSAGGPLVAPSFSGMIAQPIAPHTLTARTIVTDPSDVICIDMARELDAHAATVWADGDRIGFDAPIKRVYVRRGKTSTELLYADSEHFYKYIAKQFFGRGAQL